METFINSERWIIFRVMIVFKSLGKPSNQGDQATIKRYHQEQKEIEAKGQEAQKRSQENLTRHNTLAKGVTFFQIAIAIAAISVLTRRKWLWYGSLAVACGGVVYFVMGLM